MARRNPRSLNTDHDGGDDRCGDIPVKMEGSNLCIVSFKVCEVEVVWQGLLGAREAHGFEERLPAVLKLYDQFQLRPPLLLRDADHGEGAHGGDDALHRAAQGVVHLLLGHPELELLPDIAYFHLLRPLPGQVGEGGGPGGRGVPCRTRLLYCILQSCRDVSEFILGTGDVAGGRSSCPQNKDLRRLECLLAGWCGVHLQW